MFDPSEIINAANAAHSATTASRQATADGFMSGGMDVGSAANASNVIDTVHENGSKMLGGLSAAKSAIDRQVAAHQAQQSSELPSDFNSTMNDLRPTDAQGFPKESAADFFSTFKL